MPLLPRLGRPVDPDHALSWVCMPIRFPPSWADRVCTTKGNRRVVVIRHRGQPRRPMLIILVRSLCKISGRSYLCEIEWLVLLGVYSMCACLVYIRNTHRNMHPTNIRKTLDKHEFGAGTIGNAHSAAAVGPPQRTRDADCPTPCRRTLIDGICRVIGTGNSSRRV